jgi:GNAT superfamily N-acetyltransferase
MRAHLQLPLSFSMVEIQSVAPGSPLVDPARQLFAAYRDFLETIASTHCFDFPAYLEEIATLPAPYTEANGELLLVFNGTTPAGCIAYRRAAARHEQATVNTCEIKRLFIVPDHRKQGIAHALITEAMRRAQARGYTRAILDTDIVSMPAAHATYVALGFTEYTPPGTHAPTLRFLERSLV